MLYRPNTTPGLTFLPKLPPGIDYPFPSTNPSSRSALAKRRAVFAMMRCSDSAKLAKRAFSKRQEKSNLAA